MPIMSLYLFKTARRSFYLKENLNLLAADRGTVIEVSYNRMWIEPEFFGGSIAHGTQVFILFADRPYDFFVPVRQGEVVSAQEDETGLRLRVLLHSWIGAPDNDVAGFTEALRSSGALVPGTKFLARKRDDVALGSFYDEQEEAGWRQVVDNVLEMSFRADDDPYRRSVFFRPAGLHVGDEWLSARRVSLEPGAEAMLRLRFYNPHLESDDLLGKRLRVQAPEQALRVEAPEVFPLVGDVDLRLEALGQGEPELTIQIGPVVGRHTWVSQRFSNSSVSARATEPAPEIVAPAQAEPRLDDLRRLYEVVHRNAQFQASDELDVLDAFERLLPSEARVVERRAVLLAETGAEDAALRVLEDVDPDALGDEGRLLLFRLRVLRGDANPAPLVTTLGLASEGRIDRLLSLLDGFEPRVLSRLLPDLVEQVAPEQLPDLIRRAGERLEDPRALVDTAYNLSLVAEDVRWAFDFLNGRRVELRLSAPEVVDTLLELAGTGDLEVDDAEFAELGASRVANLIEQGQTERALSRLRQVGALLPLPARERLSGQTAGRLLEKERAEDAAHVMLELGWAALAEGEPEVATRAVIRARALLPDGADPSGVLLLQERTEALWEDCSDLVEWQRSAAERQRELLREQLLNRSILIAGGRKQADWIEHLAHMTGANIEWAEHYRGEGADLDAYAARIRQGRYALVVYLSQKSGHEVQYRLKDVCKAAEVPFVHATSAGARGLVEGVWTALPEDVRRAR